MSSKGYNLFWIPWDEDKKYILPSKREFIGTYRTIAECKEVAKDYKKASKFKNRNGEFFRNEVGSSEFVTVY